MGKGHAASLPSSDQSLSQISACAPTQKFQNCLLNLLVILFIAGYRNTAGFCVLILYPRTLLNPLTSSRSFLADSLQFSVYRTMSPMNKYNFFSNMDAFYFTFFLIALEFPVSHYSFNYPNN